MARDLYDKFDSVKVVFDYANEILKRDFSIDLLALLFGEEDIVKEQINETSITQPVLFVLQFAIELFIII